MSDGEFAALFLFTAPIAALIPAFIAQSKGRSFFGFYIYGVFFWLIALIHSLVMESAKSSSRNSNHIISESNNPSLGDRTKTDDHLKSYGKPSPAQQYPGEEPQPPETRDLSNDAYKLYLAQRYSVERNDLFNKFICDERMFDSLDDALSHADLLETSSVEIRERIKQEQERVELEQAERLAEKKRSQIEAQISIDKKIRSVIDLSRELLVPMSTIAVVIIGLILLVYFTLYEQLL